MSARTSLLGPSRARMLAWAFVAVAPAPGAGGENLAPAACRYLEGAGGELVRAGRREEAGVVLRLLRSVGLDERSLERLGSRWERRLGDLEARPERIADARRLLERAAGALEERLAQADGGEELVLARALLAIDDQHETANRLLGSSRHDGRWMAPEEAFLLRGAETLAGHEAWAASLSFDVEIALGEGYPVPEIAAPGALTAKAAGVSLHGHLPPERMRRVLTSALRACALSYAITTGRREQPRLPGAHYWVVPRGRLPEALEEAAANGGVRQDEVGGLVGHDSFEDRRGWYTCRWRSETELEALMVLDLSRTWLGWSAQPALVAGHVNWVTLRQLGALLPLLSWSEGTHLARGADVSTSRSADPRREDALWRTASRSLFGTRQYLLRLVERGEDPPWARSMTDRVGKIQDVDLLKATLVHEYLVVSGRFLPVLEATRGETLRVEAFEKALGRPLPAFEAEWRGWLEGPPRGLLQALGRSASEPSELHRHLLDAIAAARRAALSGPAPAAQVDPWLDAELCVGAEKHAAYLVRHAEQRSSWPAAHHEYADRGGFSPQGAWAGDHSVIHIGSPWEAVDTWLATFYHRLPLLDPGLLGVGLGQADDTTVADVLSLVAPWHEEVWIPWPPDGADGVPLRFAPELPVPVPGRDTSRLGYPISLQIHGAGPAPEAVFELRLSRGGPGGEAVECFVSTPFEPLNPAFAPPGAFCLIPAKPLREESRYHVSVRRAGQAPRTLEWSFETGSER